VLNVGATGKGERKCRDMNCFVTEKRNFIIDIISVFVFSD
jgi:hypothetical protein